MITEDSSRHRWLRDLVVFEGCHERLWHAAERALSGDFGMDRAIANDPDVTFTAYLDWCASQPENPRETWRAWFGRTEPSPTTL